MKWPENQNETKSHVPITTETDAKKKEAFKISNCDMYTYPKLGCKNILKSKYEYTITDIW